jgi:hypothetical protein
MEKIELVKGTIEHIQVDVRDRLNSLTDLAGTNSTYDVRKETDGSAVAGMTGLPCVVVGMSAFCLIDTTSMNKDRYELLVRFNAAPEIPYLGPFDFEVV